MCVTRATYSALLKALRAQSRALDFSTDWPKRAGLRGMAAAGNQLVKANSLVGQDAPSSFTEICLEWEQLLQARPVSSLLRPLFFAQSGDQARLLLAGYPALSSAIFQAVGDRIDQALAALRISSLFDAVVAHTASEAPARKRRPEGLLFACGDVCLHRFFGRCVVVGWDETCQRAGAWDLGQGLREVRRFGRAQPFYTVLLERDQVARYCSQENLALLTEAKVFAHPQAAFYFASARGFVPSEALTFVYPDDCDLSAAPERRDYRTLREALDG